MRCRKCNLPMFKTIYGWECLRCDWGAAEQEIKECFRDFPEYFKAIKVSTWEA